MFERHVVRKLTAYCHHELTAADSSRVQQHLEVCEPCRREYDSIADGGPCQ
jgi:predicted anti-sigma-YlaC factor YlaD